MVQRALNYYEPDLVSAVEYQLDLDLDLVTQTVQEKRQAAVE